MNPPALQRQFPSGICAFARACDAGTAQKLLNSEPKSFTARVMAWLCEAAIPFRCGVFSFCFSYS
jgi:hypothetical protein